MGQSCPAYVPVLSHTSVPRRTNQSQESKNTKKEEKTMFCALQNILEAISCGTMQPYERQTSLMGDIAVSRGTLQSHVGQISLIWERAVYYGTEESHMRKTSLTWD